MNMNNLVKICLHQIKVNKLKLLISLPGFITIVLIFILPSIVDNQNVQLHNYSELLNLYKNQNHQLDSSNLVIIILTDIKLLNYLLTMTFVIPLFLTIDLIVKEKEERTIENLFSLPLTDIEILLGKTLVSLISTIFIVWFLYFVTLIITYLYDYKFLMVHMVEGKWLFSVFMLIPAISYLINVVAITISCLVNKYQTSQFIAVFVLFPFMVFFVLVSDGTLIFYNSYFLLLFLFTLFASVIFTIISLKLFNREKILIRF